MRPISSIFANLQRRTATFLLVVMFVPAVGPLALASASTPEGMHCMRRPVRENRVATPAGPTMHCHGGAMGDAAAQASNSSSLETSLRGEDCCCPNHGCCHGLKTSEWASFTSNSVSVADFAVEPVSFAYVLTAVASAFAGPDSARAPPLG